MTERRAGRQNQPSFTLSGSSLHSMHGREGPSSLFSFDFDFSDLEPNIYSIFQSAPELSVDMSPTDLTTSCFTTREPIPIPRRTRRNGLDDADSYLIDSRFHVPPFREPWQSTLLTTYKKAQAHKSDLGNFQSRWANPPSKAPSPPLLADQGLGLPLRAIENSWPLFIVEFKGGRVDIFYDSHGHDIRTGDSVIVDTGYGNDIGKVVDDNITLEQLMAFETQLAEKTRSVPVKERKLIIPRRICGKATKEDIESLDTKRLDEIKALKSCHEITQKKGLPVRAIEAEYQWDRRQLTFLCIADDKTEFAQLAQELSQAFNTRATAVRFTKAADVRNSYLLGITQRSEPHSSTTKQSLQSPNKAGKLIERLSTLFNNKQEYRKLLQSRGMPAQRLLNMFQRVLDIVADSEPSFQRNLIVATQRLAASSGLYPASYELTDVTIPDLSECCGGFSDIYKGDFRGRAVCIKTIRLHRNSDMGHFLKVISREAVLWCQLRHPNLLPFYGIYRYKGRISFVAPWMKNGDINEYLKHNKHSNRVVLTYDVAQGMEFLHKNGIIHGDLKGTNILVNELGRALLADFGLSSISDREILAWTSFSSAASKGGTVRWQAPELFDPEGDKERHNSEWSDIYAWACVAYEIFAGQVPYSHFGREATIMNEVRNGARPACPPANSPSWTVWGLTLNIWFLMQCCWDSEPKRRPSVQEIKRRLAPALPTKLQTTLTSNILLSPGEFREMMRRNSEDIETSILTLEDILSSAK